MVGWWGGVILGVTWGLERILFVFLVVVVIVDNEYREVKGIFVVRRVFQGFRVFFTAFQRFFVQVAEDFRRGSVFSFQGEAVAVEGQAGFVGSGGGQRVVVDRAAVALVVAEVGFGVRVYDYGFRVVGYQLSVGVDVLFEFGEVYRGYAGERGFVGYGFWGRRGGVEKFFYLVVYVGRVVGGYDAQRLGQRGRRYELEDLGARVLGRVAGVGEDYERVAEVYVFQVYVFSGFQVVVQVFVGIEEARALGEVRSFGFGVVEVEVFGEAQSRGRRVFQFYQRFGYVADVISRIVEFGFRYVRVDAFMVDLRSRGRRRESFVFVYFRSFYRCFCCLVKF